MADKKISELVNYTPPLDADVLPIVDTANTTTKKITWANIKATLKTYFDTLYPSGSGTSTGTNTGNETTTTEGALINGATAKTTPVDADYVGLMDSAASNILKKLSWLNIKTTLKTYFDTLYPSGSGTSSGTNTGDQVKATGAELDTGTDDVKFATAKAIKDAHNVPSVVPSTSGNVLTSNGTDWVSSTPSSGGATAKTLIPKPMLDLNPAATNSHQFFTMAANNTTLYIGQILIPATITANKLTIRGFISDNVTQLKVALFSEDGQTRLFNITTANLTSSTAIVNETLSSVVIAAGVYYIAICSGAAAGGDGVDMWQTADPNTTFNNTVASKAVIQGTLTITAATIPATITPSSITGATNNSTLAFRLDN